jgi:hypothetical protein
LSLPGTNQAFSQNRQAIGGTKEKAVAYLSYQQTAAPTKFGAVTLSLTPDSGKIPFLSKN